MPLRADPRALIVTPASFPSPPHRVLCLSWTRAGWDLSTWSINRASVQAASPEGGQDIRNRLEAAAVEERVRVLRELLDP